MSFEFFFGHPVSHYANEIAVLNTNQLREIGFMQDIKQLLLVLGSYNFRVTACNKPAADWWFTHNTIRFALLFD